MGKRKTFVGMVSTYLTKAQMEAATACLADVNAALPATIDRAELIRKCMEYALHWNYPDFKHLLVNQVREEVAHKKGVPPSQVR